MITSAFAKRSLFAFMVAQPLPALFIFLDQNLNVVDIPRTIVFWSLAFAWGLCAIVTMCFLELRGLNVGRGWVKWLLGGALIVGVRFFAVKEAYLGIIAPFNLFIFPILTVLFARAFLRNETSHS